MRILLAVAATLCLSACPVFAQTPCSFTITPETASGAGSGGSGVIQVTGSPANCVGSWSATATVGFLSVTGTAGGSGAGPFQATYSYSENPSTSATRMGRITFNGSFPGGGTFTLTQQPATPPACTYALAPAGSGGAGGGGTSAVQVTGSPAGCSGGWSAASASSFITLTGTAGGTGSGTWVVGFSYAPNPSTSSSRQGFITFTGPFPGGNSYLLTQQPTSGGCSYAITPQAASGMGGGDTGPAIEVTGSPANCTGGWSASSAAAFITLGGNSSGSGPGTWVVPYSYSRNPSASSSRQGTVVFSGSFPGGGTFTLTQEPSSQPPCLFAINPSSASGGGTGGSGSLEVTGSPSGCAGGWSASSSAAFLTLNGTVGGGGGAGTWQVPYSWSPNPSSSAARQASISFTGSFPGGGTFLLTQQPSQPAPLPNLTPYKLDGASDKVVVSKEPGTSADDVLQPNDPLYFDWAFINNGTASAQHPFYIDLLIDGELAAFWTMESPVDPNTYVDLADWIVGPLAAGRHTLTLVLDPGNAVIESNESDNQFIRTFVIGPTVTADVNSDGKSDIVWRNRNTGMTLIWTMPAEGVLQTLTPYARDAGTDYQLAATGELGGAFPTADLLWRRTSTRQLSTQFMSAGTPQNETVWPLTPGAELSVIAAADLDGDGLAEAILRNTQTGETSRWTLGTSGVETSSIHPGGNLGWTIVAVRDLDGDTRADVLWRNAANGMTLVWFMSGSTIRAAQVIHPGGNTSWTIAGTGDFDGDAKCDLFWRQPSTGTTILWLMDGAAIRSSTQVHPGGNQGWTIAGIGDFGGDGRADVLWRENASGQTLYWKMNGASISKSVHLNSGGNLDWDIVAPR